MDFLNKFDEEQNTKVNVPKEINSGKEDFELYYEKDLGVKINFL